MSTRFKLILFNSFIVILVALIGVFTTIYATNYSIIKDYKNKLYNEVVKNANLLTTSNGNLYVDNDFSFVSDGVYLNIYKEDGEHVNGIFPLGYDSNLPLVNDKTQEYKYDGATYFTYDYYVELQGRSGVYIRGIIENYSTTRQILYITSLILLPSLCIIGIVGSIIVSRTSTKAILEVSNDADLITTSMDLSKKLNVKTKDKDILKLQDSYNKMLNRLNDLFSHEEGFISDVSHELRTPLTVLMNECEYALEINDINEKNESLNVILKQVNRMTYMVNQLLEFSRLTNNKEISLENKNIKEVMDEIKLATNSKNISLEINISNDLYLNINEVLFIRMMQNLVDNAYKYGKENGFIKIFNKNQEIHVLDNGIGIKKEDLNHIFERFYRADKSRTEKNSLGLGLSFVDEIVKLHNAKINVISKENEGSEFVIKF